MSIAPRPIQTGKRCLVYCGDERCNCDRRPMTAGKGEPAEVAAEQKLYAVRLKDGTWWSDPIIVYTDRKSASDNVRFFRSKYYSGSAPPRGSKIVPVRLVEDTDGR